MVWYTATSNVYVLHHKPRQRIDALTNSHEQSNILITDDKRACLTDFGLSRLMVLVDASAMGLSGMGTCYMMAPELFDPESYARKHAWPTKQTDVYALAMVMFEVS